MRKLSNSGRILQPMETPNPPNQKVRTSGTDDTKVLPTVFASSVLPPCGQSRPYFDMFARYLSLMCRGSDPFFVSCGPAIDRRTACDLTGGRH